jgi:murein L,D-transpeptidase YcbB/YkuD
VDLNRKWLVVGIALVAAGAAACGRLRLHREADSLVRESLQQEIGSKARPAYVTADAEGTRLWKLTRAFYERRDHSPAWIDGQSPRPQMDAVLRAIRAADREGLDPELYARTFLDGRREEASKGFLTKKGFEPGEAGRLDVLLTYTYLKYASDLADGVADLAHADRTWQIRPEKFDPLATLEKALAEDRVEQSLAGLMPDAPPYRALRDALADYRKRAAAGPWPALPASLKLKPGQRGAQVAALADRLAASGDYAPRAGDRPTTYREDLQVAVKRFQSRHGLEPDAVVGPSVVAQLNVPIEQRIRQIELNLERWRWLPRDLGKRHILVNIPAYHLEVWDAGAVPLEMRVVVGRKDTPTPIFNDTMTYLVFSPYWNVPPDIAKNETLPAILKDPDFLHRNNMEIIDARGNVMDPGAVDLEEPELYRFRQRPGAANSLGLVKFMFPNQFNVYLHDTPADSLFERATRSFSHGCVRIEKPRELARYLLQDSPEWSGQAIEEAMHAAEEQHVKLRAPIPVYLGYWTATATNEGVQFRSDVYGIDARQAARLDERLSRVKKAAIAARLKPRMATPATRAGNSG